MKQSRYSGPDLEKGEKPDSGEGKHDPAQQQGDADKGGKNLGAVNQLLPKRLFAEDRKHNGDKEGKQYQRFKMREGHSFTLAGRPPGSLLP
jgi:hypothetical protein